MNFFLQRIQPPLSAAALLIVSLTGASAAMAQNAANAANAVGRAPVPEAAQASSSQSAPASVLAHGKTINVTNADVMADAKERIPVEARDQVLSRASNVSQIVGNLYARRAMAAEAEAAGLGKTPEVEASLRVARDKVLSDAWIAKIDAQHQVNDAVAEKLARDTYKAEPQRFMAKEQVRISHILVAGTTPESRAQVEKLQEELKSGADFAKLAEASSADKASAARGGDLGFFEAGRMVPAFEQAAFALEKPGQLSGVVETQFGYHILKLQERKPAGVRPYDEVRADLIKEIRANVMQQARAEEAARLQQGMQLDKDAVSAFSGTFKPTDIQIKP